MIVLFLIVIPLFVVAVYYGIYKSIVRISHWKLLTIGAISTLLLYGFVLYYLDREDFISIGYGFYSYMFFMIIASVVTIITVLPSKNR